ncbi:MAG: hypothetical protein DWQ01_02345 [Planctomycetota bacterium]|nr:MAG: hypothetical protein DWQ01_02345 [Planctomycetota bacterium]
MPTKPIELTLGVCLLEGQLFDRGAAILPYPLLSALFQESIRKDAQGNSIYQVEDLEAQGEVELQQQAQAFFQCLKSIWQQVLPTFGGWAMEEQFIASEGTAPPWRTGAGALVRIGPESGSQTEYQLEFDNNLTGSEFQEARVEFQLGIRFA